MRRIVRAGMRLSVVAVIGLTALYAVHSPSQTKQEPTAAYRSAVFLLSQSAEVTRDGRHNELLRALRHMRDPALSPYYKALSANEHPALSIHGMLALAELSESHHVDIAKIAAIEKPAVQAELVGAALDGDLLSDADAAKLLGWADLDTGVKLLIAARLIEKDALPDTAVLTEALKAENLARRSLAAMLLMETGDSAGREAIADLDASNDPTRDTVRVMLLQTAMRHSFRSVGPWAYSIATEKDVEPAMEALAMRVGMRFGERRAVQLWQTRFAEETDIAGRIRLSLMALHLSPWLDPQVFDALLANDEPFIKQIGRTGAAVAKADANLEEQVVALLETYHPLASRWALSYAREVASPEDAMQILVGLVLIYEHGPERGKEGRLADAVEATRILHDQSHETTVGLLRPILADEKTDNNLKQAILLGLIRAKSAKAGEVITGLPDYRDPTTNQLALLLRIRTDNPLTEQQRKDLEVLVRGGGNLRDALRVQAAWRYLVLTGQAQSALTEMITPAGS